MLSPERLAKSIANFAEEHGAPNAVLPKELCAGGGFTPMEVGRVLSFSRAQVNAALRRHGYIITGYAATADKRNKRIEFDSMEKSGADK